VAYRLSFGFVFAAKESEAAMLDILETQVVRASTSLPKSVVAISLSASKSQVECEFRFRRLRVCKLFACIT
jgi:hypothetical protein